MKQLVNGATTTTTWYIRDASGNVMSTYSENAGALQLDETYIYGSSRIGSYNANLVLGQSTGGNDPIQIVEYFRGQIVYELSNHLGNVLAVITDRKIGSRLSGPGNWEHFEVDYKSFSDYYPYGMLMDGLSYSSSDYRFGFGGEEKLNEINKENNFYDYGFRIYNSRIAQFLSIDPLWKEFSWQSTYIYAANNPIFFNDILGLGPIKPPNLVEIYMHTVFAAVVQDARNEADDLFIQQQNYATDGSYKNVNGKEIKIPYIEKSTYSKVKDMISSIYGGDYYDPNYHTQRIAHQKNGKTLFTFELKVFISPLPQYNSIAKVEYSWEKIKSKTGSGDLPGKYVVTFRAPVPEGENREGRTVAMMVFDSKEDYEKFIERKEEIRNDQLMNLAKKIKNTERSKQFIEYYRKNFPGTNDKKNTKKPE